MEYSLIFMGKSPYKYGNYMEMIWNISIIIHGNNDEKNEEYGCLETPELWVQRQKVITMMKHCIPFPQKRRPCRNWRGHLVNCGIGFIFGSGVAHMKPYRILLDTSNYLCHSMSPHPNATLCQHFLPNVLDVRLSCDCFVFQKIENHRFSGIYRV